MSTTQAAVVTSSNVVSRPIRASKAVKLPSPASEPVTKSASNDTATVTISDLDDVPSAVRPYVNAENVKSVRHVAKICAENTKTGRKDLVIDDGLSKQNPSTFETILTGAGAGIKHAIAYSFLVENLTAHVERELKRPRPRRYRGQWSRCFQSSEGIVRP